MKNIILLILLSSALAHGQVNEKFQIFVTSDGKRAIVGFGDSIVAAPNATAGPEPDPNTVFQVNRITREVTEITDTDMSDAMGATVGTIFPAFGIHYYEATGFKPMILNMAVAGSTAEEWVEDGGYFEQYLPVVKAFMHDQHLTGIDIISSIGINDRDQPIASVVAFHEQYYETILTEFPGSRVFVVSPALSTPNQVGTSDIKRLIKDLVENNNRVRYAFNYQAIHAAGYFYDANHMNADGCIEAGKMFSRALINSRKLPKVAAQIASCFFEDIDSTKKEKFRVLSQSLDTLIWDLDFLALGPVGDVRDQTIDFSYLHSMGNLSLFFEAETVTYAASVFSRPLTGIYPAITFREAEVDDMFVMLHLTTSDLEDNPGYLFGADDGTTAFSLRRDGSNIVGRFNTESGDEITTAAANFTVGDRIGMQVIGDQMQFIKNGVLFGTPHTITGPQVLVDQPTGFGGRVLSGTFQDNWWFGYKSVQIGKASTMDYTILHNALTAAGL